MPPLTLIQLISEQNIPNLLPILRLQPARLVHLVTPRTAGRLQPLHRAIEAVGLQPVAETVQLSPMPGVSETHNAVRNALLAEIARQAEPVLNFTGGTKLMSIGAFSAALREKIPSLYVDTQDGCFVDGNTSPRMSELLEGDWSFTSLAHRLRVDILAIANGVPRVTPGRDWKPFLPLAEYLLGHPDDEQATHEAFFGKDGVLANGLGPRTPEQWLELLDRTFELPPAVTARAVEVGLVCQVADRVCRLPDPTRSELKELVEARARQERVPDYDRRRIAATETLQFPVNFLTGGWWEVVVAEAAARSGLFRDLRWSAQVGAEDGPDTEEDVLGLDGVELLYINCKRGGQGARLLPLLEEMRARAATIGGAFNRCFLAVRQPLNGVLRRNLTRRAHDLGITLLTPDNLFQPDAFARPSRTGQDRTSADIPKLARPRSSTKLVA